VVHRDQFLVIEKGVARFEIAGQIGAAGVAETATVHELTGGELETVRSFPPDLPIGLPTTCAFNGPWQASHPTLLSAMVVR